MTDSTAAARTATLVALPVALIVGLASVWWLGGFGDAGRSTRARPQSTAPVSMPAPPLDQRPAAACRELLSRLPAALRDRPRRPVTAGAGQNAAYGDPAIAMSCGGPALTLPVGAFVYPLSGVCWYSQPGDGATVWTTVDRDTPVRVTVPSSYESPGQWVIEFSAPVSAVLPRGQTVPDGC
jgi:hypothetical protein